MLKPKTLELLNAARLNKVHPVLRPLYPEERLELAMELRKLRRIYGAAKAREMHREYHKPSPYCLSQYWASNKETT